MRRTIGWLLPVLLLTGCSPTPVAGAGDDPGPTGMRTGLVNEVVDAFGLDQFAGCDEVLTFLQTHALEQVTAWGLGGWFGPVMFDTLGRGSMTAAAAMAESDSGSGFSTTNLQELGVDEADIVKTDGIVLVALSYDKLYVADVSGVPKLLGSLSLGEITPQSLFLVDDRVFVIGSTWQVMPMVDDARAGIVAENAFWMPPDLAMVEVDISDPKRPVETSRMTMKGNVLAARMVEDSIRLVVTGQPPSLPFVTPDMILTRWPFAQQQDPRAWERAERLALSQNRAIISSSQINDWLPAVQVTGSGGLSTITPDCGSLARPAQFSGLNLTSVLTFDTDSSDPTTPVDAFGLVSDAVNVYSSTDNIYVATQQWQNWGAVPEGEWDRVAGFTTTEIHRFDLSDPSAVSYQGSGEVAGWLYSQWAMSESGGYLRVASTTQSPWWGQRPETTQSIVSVLGIEESGLVQVGAVTGLGVTEQIYAVRFIGDKGYVVTYRQVDPLYVIDLSDPRDPAVAGELKIPGYSAYLHPINDHLLLGVGQDGDLEGRTIGTQVALFDVTDPTAPTQIDKLTLPGAYSGAEWDHHAFLYWPESDDAGLVVIPIQGGDNDGWWQGSLAVDVDSGGVREVGQLEQSGYVLRNLIVGDRLLTVTDTGIQSYDYDSLEPGDWVSFA